MSKLSIIIVSYNVKDLLEQCLYSVQRASSGIDADVIVVDNNSADGSAGMVEEKFPQVKLIQNKSNPGFSKANNQARPYARGEYILFLNPDTVIRDNTLVKCIEFMDSHPGAGAMGVRMNDGRGRYLPESKRSVPTLPAALYKISGLTAMFPRSATFGRYYLGHLDKEITHKIEVLTGAFFFARRKALEQTGWFDEDFFMYGEDIDLSLRILKHDYTVWYYPGTSITHFKGESTRKSSINYVVMFYRAMMIYVRKHFDSPGSVMFLSLLYVAIWFRAGLSIIKRLLVRILLPVADFTLIAGGYLLIHGIWSRTGIHAEENRVIMATTIAVIWTILIWLSGGYKDPRETGGLLKGILGGSLLILLVFAMLSPQWYGRIAVILPLGLLSVILSSLARSLVKKRRNRQG